MLGMALGNELSREKAPGWRFLIGGSNKRGAIDANNGAPLEAIHEASSRYRASARGLVSDGAAYDAS